MPATRSGESGPGALLAAIDVGTTGARAMAIDLDARVVAEVRRPYPTRSPRPGWAEQDARDWSEHAVDALRGLATRVRRPERIAGIGLTGQSPTVVPVDARGRPVGPGMMYRDNRAVEEAREMRRRIGERRMHRRCGHTAEAFHIGPKVLWLRRHEPEVFGRTVRFLQPRDVVVRRLSGREATDESHADATLFFDLRARAWAPDLFDAFDLDPSLFPEALPPWAVAAGLPRRLAVEVGLRPGIPIVIGAGDSQCVAFGAGVVEPGPVSEMSGSSSCLNSAVVRPVSDIRVTHYSHVVPDRYTTELGLNTTGAAVDWAVSRLGYSGYEELAADADRFRRRMLRGGDAADVLELAPLFLPYLGDGERDDPSVRAGFVGLSFRHDRPALAFSVLEGIALGIRATIEILHAAGSPLDELRVGGGGARLPILGRVKADVLRAPVLHLDGDSAAIGTALLAADAAGLGSEVEGAIGRFLSRGRRFLPTERGVPIERVRAAWFDEVHGSDAVHMREAP
jgi:sugar (pentulose or hexulose) kinase